MRVEFKKDRNRVVLYDEKNKLVGESTFSLSDMKWIIDHTYVDESLRGKGYASKLVEKIIERAREKNIKIIPLCPYAKREFEKHSEYDDVLFK
ncbi:N-acetyltransferase [Anaerococcus sp. AGMB00486]|uniref:N-acetyltransferase n=2 Tax=Anaerococcus TaxID=165779 RepID=A0ABX2N7T4_9FIRM|nr:MULTISPECIES: GNAT family N-acetyltransferase [Anaerococcus]MDY3006831.1 GNAT family N-acetyltransferase [Anaerococcus porci]MSS78349.1 N-acetyltransferase [Anaerococcus porci]NVF10745.1 N-acetyltransferase [Anaerococcus faecalis]